MLKKLGHGFLAFSLLVATSFPATAADPFQSTNLNESALATKGVTAGFRFVLPFGPADNVSNEPTLTLGIDMHKRFNPTGSPRDMVSRSASLAAIDFTDRGFDRLSLANQTAFSNRYDEVTGERLGFSPTPSALLWTAVIVGAAVGIYFLVEDDDNSESEMTQ